VIIYKSNTAHTLQAAHSGSVRIGYIDRSTSTRWIWSLNMIQPRGGRAHGIEDTEEAAKAALQHALIKWVGDAGLQFKEQNNVKSERSVDHADA
jgi:hypothetical protein